MKFRMLFLIGLLCFLVGQILLAQGNDFVYSQEPIDFAHWFLLVGAALLIPQAISFPKSIYTYIGAPLTYIGLIAMIGMCVLDFIWWSFPSEAARIAFTNHITQVPSVWQPFIKIGPSSKVFNLGLLILSFNYFQKDKIGIAFILTANLVLWHIIPLPFRLVSGYALTLVGFGMLFFSDFKK